MFGAVAGFDLATTGSILLAGMMLAANFRPRRQGTSWPVVGRRSHIWPSVLNVWEKSRYAVASVRNE